MTRALLLRWLASQERISRNVLRFHGRARSDAYWYELGKAHGFSEARAAVQQTPRKRARKAVA